MIKPSSLKMRATILVAIVFLISTNACKNQQPKGKLSTGNGLFQLFDEGERDAFYSDKKGVYGQKGMVASAHPVASQVGVEILKSGGNAADAAVATFFALAVVYPFAGNLGGGGFAVVRDDKGEAYALDFREKAPLKAHKDMYLDENGDVIKGLSIVGHLASGVPGAVAGMVELHEKLGSKPWKEVLAPAIKLAKEGVVLTAGQANGMNRSRETFLKVNGPDLKYYIKEGGLDWAEGETFVQGDLGESLVRIQKEGRDGFYKGKTADLLVKEMESGGGIISHEDLEQYDAVWREPIQEPYKNYKIISMPPASSGGVALVQLLKLVEPYPLKDWGWNTANTAQVMIEAERRVYADRAKWLGDEDFVKVPMKELMSEPYLKERWASFNPDRATLSSDIEGGTIPFYESDQTTHFSIVDKNGMAVSITTTLNGGYGSKVVVDGGGFFMNNEMDDFSIKAGVPNMFGLIGNKANEIQPGKRMLSSMTPTIVEKDGELFLVVGTPGGSTIITSVYQTILNVIEHGMSMQQAVNALKFHHQWLPDKIYTEKNAFDNETLQTLLNKGYIIEIQNRTLGRMDCIMVHPNGTLEGGSDPRSENTSIGY
ncbi:gamma-glutamyltransferase [Marinilongibacter aquaticus]|uniref:gamma-glutamyltransferase n=1 Tax=Marinilongibacter aquaticus TaxID=2975157 RepID=UPI0021BD35DC|nr:gamma-glutamyltransferase [Marinilongibacter aquaticus]UBM58044.1 gamma-glutamyltransferase [Marinilongibacter aquaticus]